MTWFSLPETRTKNTSAFFDSGSAAAWLAGQPQANAQAMLTGVVAQIQAFNTYSTSPRERFKTLEVLRKSIFAVSGECQRRYENKPLPLLPGEKSVLDSTRQLWRACATGYLHCLQACLAGDLSIAPHSAKVTHRVLSCLRMEQMNCYLASTELDSEFWRILHAVLASAEQLDITLTSIEDRLLGETSESTVSGQYCMILLLHLARPFALTRAQFSAVTRWLARWREQASVLTAPDENPKACCLALDLSRDQPVHDNLRVAALKRWLSIQGVLRKIRQRLERLAAGESPERLKLGSGLSADACVELLRNLSDFLKYPQHLGPETLNDAPRIAAASGLENIFRLLGGKGLKEHAMGASSFDSILGQNQLAVFGHVVRESDSDRQVRIEQWQIVRREENEELQLIRPDGSGDARLLQRGLVVIQLPQHIDYTLATITSLYSRCDGNLCLTIRPRSHHPLPLIAEMREKATGNTLRYPAIMLPAAHNGGTPSVILPSGVMSRAASIRFLDAHKQTALDLRLDGMIERGADQECWSLAEKG